MRFHRAPGAKYGRAVLAGLAVLVGALAVWMWQRSGGVTGADGPTVIISIDTLRADRLPAYGYTRIKTPQIDRFVADAVRFDEAYSHSPQTLPAHASILSGQLPFAHGVRDNIGFSVKQGQRFLQQTLRERGFATAGFVSAYVLRHQIGINQGFDTYDDALPPAAPDRPLGQVQRPGGETVAAAIRWIDGRTSPKFLLFVHIYEPHKPYTPPERFARADPYDGEVEYSDEIVGRLLDYLRQKNLYDPATIVLLSDHGEGLGDHGEDEHGIFLYRETVRVPLVVKIAGSKGGGRSVSTPVQHVDIAPTLLDLAGVDIGTDFPGRSLRPVLDGSGSLAAADIYSEAMSPRYHFGWSELYAITSGRFRLIRAPRDELYDVAADPGERVSIVEERPQVHAGMRRALDTMIANVAPSAPAAVSEEERRKLTALGYVAAKSSASPDVPGDRLPDPKDKVSVLLKYRKATELAGERRYDEAIVLFREVLAGDPDMTDVWLQLGEIYGRRGLTAEAVSAYREVIARNPQDPAGLTGAAAGLLKLGRLDEARAHAELAVKVAPATAHELLARIAVERNDPDAARREARLAHDVDPTLPLPDVIEGLIFHKRGEYAAAVPPLLNAKRALAARTVQIGDVNFYLGDSLARLERYAEAEPYFAAEIALFPGHVRARAGLAMLYRAMGREPESNRAVADLLRFAPTREGYDVAAQLWTMFGEPQRAAAVREEMRRLR